MKDSGGAATSRLGTASSFFPTIPSHHRKRWPFTAHSRVGSLRLWISTCLRRRALGAGVCSSSPTGVWSLILPRVPVECGMLLKSLPHSKGCPCLWLFRALLSVEAVVVACLCCDRITGNYSSKDHHCSVQQPKTNCVDFRPFKNTPLVLRCDVLQFSVHDPVMFCQPTEVRAL